MAKLERQLEQSKALRDASLRLISDDLGFLRGGIANGEVRQRAVSQLGGGTKAVAGSLVNCARGNRGLVGGIIAAIVLFLFRKPILNFALNLFDRRAQAVPDDQEPEAADDHSDIEIHDIPRDMT